VPCRSAAAGSLKMGKISSVPLRQYVTLSASFQPMELHSIVLACSLKECRSFLFLTLAESHADTFLISCLLLLPSIKVRKCETKKNRQTLRDRSVSLFPPEGQISGHIYWSFNSQIFLLNIRDYQKKFGQSGPFPN